MQRTKVPMRSLQWRDRFGAPKKKIDSPNWQYRAAGEARLLPGGMLVSFRLRRLPANRHRVVPAIRGRTVSASEGSG